RFTELWDAGAVGRHEASRKTVDHPQVGAVTLDCDVLGVAGSDLRIMVYSAEPGTDDAERLALLAVVGTQDLAGSPAAADWARVGGAGLDAAPGLGVEESDGDGGADLGSGGGLPQQVEVAQDERALGEDRERVGAVAQRADDAGHQPVAALRALVAVHVGAHR